MAQTLTQIIADFDTQLSTASSIGGTTATIVTATDDDGNALPTGTYGLTIDAGSSSKEYIVCTLTGTSLTAIQNITRQGVVSSGFAKSHRRGAKVTITDWAIMKRILNNLDGTTGFNSSVKLGYDADPAITSTDLTKFATVKFVNDTSIAGAPDATTATKGISKMSVAPVSAINPIAVGDNDPRVPTQGENDALVGNNTDVAVGAGNKYVTQTGLQHNAEKYAADTGSTDTYAINLSPVPTSYTNGMVVYFKANTVNTGAATLNVNSLGAKTIVKGVNTTLADGDIAAGQFCVVIYDGTNFVLTSPISNAFPSFTLSCAKNASISNVENGSTRYADNTGSGAGSSTFGNYSPLGGTLKNFTVKPITNAFTQSSTYTIRVNGTNSAATVTIPAGSTTAGTDSTNSPTITKNDVIDIVMTSSNISGASLTFVFTYTIT